MKVTKDQIIKGILTYAENEVIPKMDDRSTQILTSIAIKSVAANTKLVDSIFENPTVKTLLNCDGEGMCEIDTLFQTIEDSIRQYGPLPVEIPPLPFISPSIKTLSFSEADISEMKRRIERSV